MTPPPSLPGSLSGLLRLFVGGLALCAVALAGACKPDLIPGTNIEDTAQNREVIDLMESYKTAIESRDADKVLQLVAEEYFEDNASVAQDDDYGIERLRQGLERDFAHTEVIQLQVTIQEIEPVEDSDRIHVYYRYLQRALLDLPAGDRWVSASDVNRLVLKPKGDKVSDGYLILSGL